MPGDKEIVGGLSQTVEYITTVEWTIKDIFLYTKENQAISSPTFTLPGSLWHLSIYHVQASNDSVGWISAYLYLEESSTPKDVDYKFRVKKKDGSYEMIPDKSEISHVFKLKEDIWGYPKFLKRSELQRREHELAPSGDLTLACIMKLKDGLDLETLSRFNNLSENLENLFNSKRGSDATLKVKDKDFAVHRSILIARSPVLGAMFEVDMEEKNTGIVNIVDCHPGAMQDFLTYIYSGKFIITSKDVFQLYRIAHKYDVEQLKSDCVAYMIHNLSVDTLFDAAIIGHEFDENELKNKTQDFFNKEFAKIAHSSKWKSFLKDNLSLGHELLENMADKLESLAQGKEGAQ